MREFENRVNEASKNEPNSRSEPYTEEDICHLPPVVQKYMRYCGYLGTEKIDRAEIKWTDVYHKRNQKSKWMKLNYRQFNSACGPTRIVRIHAKLMGIIPLDIAEEYIENKGIWQMKVLKKINLLNVTDIDELNRTSLVTFLSEALLLPTIAISPYMTWSEMDELRAKAVLKHNHLEVSGIFTFNSLGEFIGFETLDRYNSEDGKAYKLCKWTGVCSAYTEKNGIKFPTVFKGIWKAENGNFEYFSGRISEILSVSAFAK